MPVWTSAQPLKLYCVICRANDEVCAVYLSRSEAQSFANAYGPRQVRIVARNVEKLGEPVAVPVCRRKGVAA